MLERQKLLPAVLFLYCGDWVGPMMILMTLCLGMVGVESHEVGLWCHFRPVMEHALESDNTQLCRSDDYRIRL